MYHCHMLTHEDGGMMGQFIVYDPLSTTDETSNTELKIFPNPASSLIHFESEKEVGEIIIYSIDGKSILTKFVEPSKTIDVSDLMDGSYLIEIALENGTRIMRKVNIFR